MNWHAVSEAAFPALGDQEVHLWWLPLTLDPVQTELALSWLSDIQRDKYVRRAASGQQLSYLAGRYFLLKLLGAYVGQKPADVLLSYSRLNKPYLSHHEQCVEFNFTDTRINERFYGLFAFSKNRAVGVDIEALSRRSNFHAIAQRRFTVEELAFVGEPVNPEKFLALWTRKEAYGKATGLGINFKMNQRNLVKANKLDLAFADDDERVWQLSQIQPHKDFIASVVYSGDQSLSVKAFNSLNQAP